jgi:hypothetical protein
MPLVGNVRLGHRYGFLYVSLIGCPTQLRSTLHDGPRLIYGSDNQIVANEIIELEQMSL